MTKYETPLNVAFRLSGGFMGKLRVLTPLDPPVFQTLLSSIHLLHSGSLTAVKHHVQVTNRKTHRESRSERIPGLGIKPTTSLLLDNNSAAQPQGWKLWQWRTKAGCLLGAQSPPPHWDILRGIEPANQLRLELIQGETLERNIRKRDQFKDKRRFRKEGRSDEDERRRQQQHQQPTSYFWKAAVHLKTCMTETQGSIDFISRALKALPERPEVKL